MSGNSFTPLVNAGSMGGFRSVIAADPLCWSIWTHFKNKDARDYLKTVDGISILIDAGGETVGEDFRGYIIRAPRLEDGGLVLRLIVGRDILLGRSRRAVRQTLHTLLAECFDKVFERIERDDLAIDATRIRTEFDQCLTQISKPTPFRMPMGVLPTRRHGEKPVSRMLSKMPLTARGGRMDA